MLSPTISVANASTNEIGNVSSFVAFGSGGLSAPKDMVMGPDGNVYVVSSGTNSVIRYTPSGQLLGIFVTADSGGLSSPFGLAFGPDGNLHVASSGTNAIYEYSGGTGAFLKTFVASGSNGLSQPSSIVFGPDGNLYVSSGATESVDRFEGPTGPNPGSPLPAAGQSGANFVAPQSGGLSGPREPIFGPNGNQYGNSIGQYNSGVVATLSAASSSPVTVQYATSDGTALAGTDYTAQTGTVTFAPGQTSRLIPLVTLYDATPPANDYFNVQLSNPSGATIASGSAVVTIVPSTLPQLATGNASAIEGDPTAHYRGAAAYGSTTDRFNPVTIGPDGNIYTSSASNTIERYNGTTGAFMGIFATGPLNGPRTILFKSGYMYVASELTNQVLQFNATTGAYQGVFVASGSGGISGPYGMTFGPNRNLYVSGRNSNNVVEYNGTTGALIGTFVAAGSGGLNLPEGITFDPSGQYLYLHFPRRPYRYAANWSSRSASSRNLCLFGRPHKPAWIS